MSLEKNDPGNLLEEANIFYERLKRNRPLTAVEITEGKALIRRLKAQGGELYKDSNMKSTVVGYFDLARKIERLTGKVNSDKFRWTAEPKIVTSQPFDPLLTVSGEALSISSFVAGLIDTTLLGQLKARTAGVRFGVSLSGRKVRRDSSYQGRHVVSNVIGSLVPDPKKIQAAKARCADVNKLLSAEAEGSHLKTAERGSFTAITDQTVSQFNLNSIVPVQLRLSGSEVLTLDLTKPVIDQIRQNLAQILKAIKFGITTRD